MTYKQLVEEILSYDNIQNQDVIVYINDDYYPITKIVITKEDDVLDKNHIFLTNDKEKHGY